MSEEQGICLGIDLGTSNCAVALASLSSESIEDLLLPQLSDPGVIGR